MLMLNEFKLDHNAKEATKNIYCANGEGAVDFSSDQIDKKKNFPWIKQGQVDLKV